LFKKSVVSELLRGLRVLRGSEEFFSSLSRTLVGSEASIDREVIRH
jgi:hypothetical protein